MGGGRKKKNVDRLLNVSVFPKYEYIQPEEAVSVVKYTT